MTLISEYPWYWALLCIMAGLIYAMALYVRDTKNLDRSKFLLYGLFFLRAISVTGILLLLLNVFIKRVVNETEKPIIILAQDNSYSIIANNKDSVTFRNAYTEQVNELINRLSSKYDIKSYLFDSRFTLGNTPNYTGKETDLSNVFNEIENNYANRNIGAVVLTSDGIYNKGTNPLYTVEKLKFPIYTIALGDTTVVKDAWIQKVNHNQIAYLNNQFPVEVIVNATKLSTRKITVSITHQGATKASQTAIINTANYSQTFNFLLDADKTGVQKYTVVVSTLPEETNKQNNSQSFVIDVIDNREKILILAQAPHPDIAAIKESIDANQNYETDVVLINDLKQSLKPYSLVIVHQSDINPTTSKLLNELKVNNQSCFLITSEPIDNLSSVKIQKSSTKFNDAEALYNKSFPLFTVSDELRGYFKDFPAVKTIIGNYNFSNASNSLLNQKIGSVETSNPLLVFTETSGYKLGLFLGDGLWRWRLRDYADHGNHNLYNELLSKIVQYLSVKADKRFFRVQTKKIVNENEPIDFTAEVYNESYELIIESDVLLTLKNEAKKEYNYTFSKSASGYVLDIGVLAPGDYTYIAKVKVGDKLYTQNGIVTVKPVVVEQINTIANHGLLAQLSKQTGGHFYYTNQLEQLEKELVTNENIKSITYSHKILSDLISIKWLFFFILLLLSIEWFLRKRNGSV